MNPIEREPSGRPLAFLCRGRSAGRGTSAWARARAVAGAVPLIALGVVLIATPAPGGVLIGSGLSLLGREFRATRRVLVTLQWRVRLWRRRRALAAIVVAH